jgi:hypothetical protein
MASKLPFTFQRTLAFLPLHLDSDAQASAQATLDWRIQMWTALLPQIPEHLLLGKGLGVSPLDFQQMMGADAPLAASANFDASQDALALSYDYHNGPLSVLIPFGIWGAIAFLWLVWAGLRALRLNYRYGDPALQTVNGFLLASFAASLITFLFMGGALSTDLMRFTGILGLSVALNGGVRRSAPQPGPEAVAARSPSPMRPRLQPAFLK